jgi:uncharacterized coiled-coil DUF342 family protein
MAKISDSSKGILKEKLIGLKAQRNELKKHVDELTERLVPIETRLRAITDEIDDIEKDLKEK